VPRTLDEIRQQEGENFLSSGRNFMEDLAVETVERAAAALLAKMDANDHNGGHNAAPAH